MRVLCLHMSHTQACICVTVSPVQPTHYGQYFVGACLISLILFPMGTALPHFQSQGFGRAGFPEPTLVLK